MSAFYVLNQRAYDEYLGLIAFVVLFLLQRSALRLFTVGTIMGGMAVIKDRSYCLAWPYYKHSEGARNSTVTVNPDVASC